MPYYAFARAKLVKTVQALRRLSEHAARRNTSAVARKRPDADDARRAVGWAIGEKTSWIASPAPEPGPLPAVCDYVAAFKRRKGEAGAGERKGSSVALHVLLGVSPAWCETTGDLHDLNNPRVQALYRAARLWGDRTFGEGATIAARMDLDEAGGAVVDLVITPVHDLRLGKARQGKPTVSVTRGLTLLAKRHAKPSREAMVALQSDWVAWAQEQLDPALQRGTPAKVTGRRHVPPDEYKRRMERLEAERAETEAALAAAREALAATETQREDAETVLTATRDELRNARANVAAAQEDLRGWRALLQEWIEYVEGARGLVRRMLGPAPPKEPEPRSPMPTPR